jgi:hypothetical protein
MVKYVAASDGRGKNAKRNCENVGWSSPTRQTMFTSTYAMGVTLSTKRYKINDRECEPGRTVNPERFQGHVRSWTCLISRRALSSTGSWFSVF